MADTVLRLFPPPSEQVALRGLYLALELHRRGSPECPFVYANFLTSLDGRIALEDDEGKAYLPRTLTTPDDFRLFLELAAQADCLVTHGGYLRALAEGRLGNILQIGVESPHRDLADWRLQQALTPQPAIVIASASLDFPMPETIARHEQACYIATGQQADPRKVADWRRRGFEVLITGSGRMVEAQPLVEQLGAKGHRTIYLIAGPHMLDTVVRQGRLGLLFQTITHQLLGGASIRTLLPGAEMGVFGRLKLVSLYYDSTSPMGTGQWFAQFQNAR